MSFSSPNSPLISFESVEISDYILDEICQQAAKRLYSKYIKEKIPDHNGNYVVGINRGIVQLELVVKDEGENQFTYINKWNEEEEPVI